MMAGKAATRWTVLLATMTHAAMIHAVACHYAAVGDSIGELDRDLCFG